MSFKSGIFIVILAAVLCVVWPFAGTSQCQQGTFVDPAVFKEPPAEFRGHAMWGFNLTGTTEQRIVSGIQGMAKQNMGGIVPEPSGGSTAGLPDDYLKATGRKPVSEGIVYLSEEYFKFYRLALEEARKNGLEIVLYDEWRYPTGMVNGQLYAKYPQHVAKSLEMTEKNVTGPAKTELAVPANLYVGAVMMNRDTYELVDISSQGTPGKTLVARVPKGNWKVMVFYLDPTIRPASEKGAFVDYLDSTAMDAFISISYQKIFDHVGEFFGKEIKFSFWDEPAMHPIDGRMWTPLLQRELSEAIWFLSDEVLPCAVVRHRPTNCRRPQRIIRIPCSPVRHELRQEDPGFLRGAWHPGRRSFRPGGARQPCPYER